MLAEPKTILISRRPGTACDDVAALVRTLGFEPFSHDLGSVPAVDFDPLAAAFLLVEDNVESAFAQTKRWRVELGERFCPVAWLDGPEGAAAIDAGADALFCRPFDVPAIAAQLRAWRRIQRQVEGLRSRAAEIGILSEMLARGRDFRRREADLARATLRLGDMPPPDIVDSLQFGSIQSDEPDTTLVDTAVDGETARVLVAKIAGHGGLASSLTGLLVRGVALLSPSPSVTPGGRVRRVNRAMLERQFDYLPASLVILDIDCRTGEFQLAGAGMADAAVLRADDTVESIPFGASQLGVFETDFPTRTGQLHCGEKLFLADRSIHGGDSQAASHRDRTAQEYLNSLPDRPAVGCAIARVHLP